MYGSLNYRVRRVGEEGDKSKAANFVVSRFLPPASNSPPSGVAIAPPGFQWSWLISCCLGSTSFFCLHFWVERWGYSFPSGLNLYNFLRNFIDFKLIQLRSWTVIEIYNHEMFHEVGSIFSSAVAKNRFLSFYSTAAAFQWPLPIYRYALLYHSYHHLAHHHCKVLVLYLSRLHSWMRWTTAVHNSVWIHWIGDSLQGGSWRRHWVTNAVAWKPQSSSERGLVDALSERMEWKLRKMMRRQNTSKTDVALC